MKSDILNYELNNIVNKNQNIFNKFMNIKWIQHTRSFAIDEVFLVFRGRVFDNFIRR